MVIKFDGRKQEDKSFDKMLKVWGNGNSMLGYSLFYAVTMRLEYARAKHNHFANDKNQAMKVIQSEVNELDYAIKNETNTRQYDESLDVIATALRFANKEYE